MTREERDRLRGLIEAASSGPWERGDIDDEPNDRDAAIWGGMDAYGSRVCVVDDAQYNDRRRANVELIVASRNSLRELLDIVDAADVVVRAVRARDASGVHEAWGKLCDALEQPK